MINPENLLDMIKDFVGQYEYEFDETKWHFFMQPFPILNNCVTMVYGKMIKIDNQEKFDRASKKVYKQMLRILSTEEKLSERLLGLMFICIHKPFHIPLLIHIKDELDKDVFSEILESVWTSTEFPHQNTVPILLELFSYANREKLMNEEELQTYLQFPPTIKVYRGLQKDAIEKGMSWTTDLKTANWFANRFDNGGKVLTATINKKDIYAYKMERQEFEIILDPRKLIGVK